MNTQQKSDLPDAKSIDGPSVSWTPFDNIKSSPQNAMTYHVIQAGYSAMTPLGAAAGGILYGLGWRRFPSIFATMGSTGLFAGGVGMLMGLGGMQSISKKGEKATPKWNEEGIQQRVDGLSHNFKVRVIDLSTWAGIGIAAVALVGAGGPGRIKLSPGVLGAFQAVSLGSTLGSLGAIGCIFATAPKDDEDE
jgi:hypothetical protein